jgi:hypothetical protein
VVCRRTRQWTCVFCVGHEEQAAAVVGGWGRSTPAATVLRYLARGPVYVLSPVVGIERLNIPSFQEAGYRLVSEGCGGFYQMVRKR